MKGPHFPGSLLKKLLLVGILDRRKKMDKLMRAELRLDKEVSSKCKHKEAHFRKDCFKLKPSYFNTVWTLNFPQIAEGKFSA